MTLLYGQRGQAAGTIFEDAFFGRDGSQLGLVEGDHLYSIIDGGYIGSYVSGVVFAANGEPQAFAANAKESIPLMTPKLRSVLVPKVSQLGEDVRAYPGCTPPEFLRASFATAQTEWFK